MKMLMSFSDRARGVGTGGAMLLILIGAAAWALYFPARENMRLNHELDEARHQLSELQVLYPLYVDLLRAGPEDKWAGLPRPPRQELTQEDVVNVPSVFSEMSRSCDMSLVSVSPHVVAGSAGRRQLKVDLQVAGSYARMPDLLLGLIGMPSMEQIEAVDVRREAVNETFRCSFWLALN